MAWRSSIASSIHCGASESEKISALIIFTIRSLANKLTLCSPMHDLLGLRIRGRVTGPPEVIPVLCRQWTLCGLSGQVPTSGPARKFVQSGMAASTDAEAAYIDALPSGPLDQVHGRLTGFAAASISRPGEYFQRG